VASDIGGSDEMPVDLARWALSTFDNFGEYKIFLSIPRMKGNDPASAGFNFDCQVQNTGREKDFLN
jgi:hypothetical protein